ncbi:MAG: hypothetical protein AAGF24_01070 [Cyanobacteria bacterium P01_H01_bin.121]
MDAQPESSVTAEFRRECSVRRTLAVLAIKQRRLQTDLEQFVMHLGLLIPEIRASQTEAARDEMLAEALQRLGDDTFAALIAQTLQRLEES